MFETRCITSGPLFPLSNPTPWSRFGFLGGSDSKASACNAGDPGLIPGWGRSPGEGNGNPLQYACLENSMNGGAWLASIYGAAKSWTQMSNFTSLDHVLVLVCHPRVLISPRWITKWARVTRIPDSSLNDSTDFPAGFCQDGNTRNKLSTWLPSLHGSRKCYTAQLC